MGKHPVVGLAPAIAPILVPPETPPPFLPQSAILHKEAFLLSHTHLPSSVDRINHFLTRYIHATGMALDIHAEFQPAPAPDTAPDGAQPILHVHFTGPDVPLLLDRQAELLNALEHLAAKLLGLSPEEHHRIRFDAAGYKLGRDQQLANAAAQAIAEVNRSGQPFRLSPMNSRERRVLHLLAAEAGLRSASTGDGPFRSVTLYPTSSTTTVPEPVEPAAPPATAARTARLRTSFRRR